MKRCNKVRFYTWQLFEIHIRFVKVPNFVSSWHVVRYYRRWICHLCGNVVWVCSSFVLVRFFELHQMSIHKRHLNWKFEAVATQLRSRSKSDRKSDNQWMIKELYSIQMKSNERNCLRKASLPAKFETFISKKLHPP